MNKRHNQALHDNACAKLKQAASNVSAAANQMRRAGKDGAADIATRLFNEIESLTAAIERLSVEG